MYTHITWLKSLKVGDNVIVCQPQEGYYRLRTVTELTKRLIITSDGFRFKKSDGEQHIRYAHSFSLREPTKELREKARNSEFVGTMLERLLTIHRSLLNLRSINVVESRKISAAMDVLEKSLKK